MGGRGGVVEAAPVGELQGQVQTTVAGTVLERDDPVVLDGLHQLGVAGDGVADPVGRHDRAVVVHGVVAAPVLQQQGQGRAGGALTWAAMP